MTTAHKVHWDARYRTEYQGPRPARSWLADHADVVDMRAQMVRLGGRAPTALDIACGPARNSLFLAKRGWQVTGVDISDEAIALGRDMIVRNGLSHQVDLIQSDLDVWQPQADSFDLIICFFFLDRALWPWIRSALRPGGVFIMETFNTNRRDSFPSDFLLSPGELSTEVRSWGWHLLAWRSDGPEMPRPTDAIVAVKSDWRTE